MTVIISCSPTVKCLVSSWIYKPLSRHEAYTHHVYHVGLGHTTHVYIVTLFHSWRQLHLQDRVQTNKVFHTRLVLTVHWLFRRSIIGILSATYRGKNRRSRSEMFKAKRPEGQITASYFQNLHYIKVNQAQRENCVFLCFAQTGVGEVDVSPPTHSS